MEEIKTQLFVSSRLMPTEITLNDPIFTRKVRYNAFDKFLLKLIADERDLVFLHLVMRIAAFVFPMILYLYLPGRFSWWIAIPYLLISWIFFLGPYILMLHCTSHRRLFKKKYDKLNKIIPWFLGPFFGETPETYFGHHLGMHHPENNLPDDLSSTMRYQRDSKIDFAIYFFRFFFLAMPEITLYFKRRNRRKLMWRVLLGELSWYSSVLGLSVFNFYATLAVFIIPFIFTRFMMMAGNWGQHAFIDADSPQNCYRNSITCINVSYNRKCFNDGYHIIHHIKPALHYTEMPGEFLANRATYAKEKAIVFEGIDFFMVWFFLMMKDYKTLARKFVRLDDSLKTEQEIIVFLKSRTRRIDV